MTFRPIRVREREQPDPLLGIFEPPPSPQSPLGSNSPKKNFRQRMYVVQHLRQKLSMFIVTTV